MFAENVCWVKFCHFRYLRKKDQESFKMRLLDLTHQYFKVHFRSAVGVKYIYEKFPPWYLILHVWYIMSNLFSCGVSRTILHFWISVDWSQTALGVLLSSHLTWHFKTFLWEYKKSKVYFSTVNNCEKLIERVGVAIAKLDNEQIQQVTWSVQMNWQHIQHLL